MATIKVNGTSYFASADKITTPSLIIHDGIYVGISSTPGTGGADPHPVYLNAYIPLFRGNINSTVDYDRWRYTLGALKVGDYRAAVSRTSILFESTVFWVDFNTRYIGTYSDNGSTITITDTTGSGGTPYQQFCGFEPSLKGKSLTWDVISNGSSIKSRWTQRCSYVNDNPVIVDDIEGDNIDGTTPENHYGVKICEGWVPNGKYDLIFTVIDGAVTYKYYLHVVMNVPNNPGGSL